MTSARASAMRSPDRFMARDLAEEVGDEKGAGLVILRSELLRTSKDGERCVSILRDAAKWPLLRMTTEVVEALKAVAFATATAAEAAAGAADRSMRPHFGPPSSR